MNAIVHRPLRESVFSPTPGDVIDGQLVGIPRYERVTNLSASLPWMGRARRHMVIDGMPAKEAGRRTRALARLVTRLARQAGKRGWCLSVHAPESLSGQGPTWGFGAGGISAVVWLTDSHRIVGQAKVTWDGAIIRGGVHYRGSARADRLLARILAG